MVMPPTENFRPSSRRRDEMEAYVPYNTFHSTSSSEFPQPENQQSTIHFSIPEHSEMSFPFISQINPQATQEPPNHEGQFLSYATPLTTVQESNQQGPSLPTPADFDAFPDSYYHLEQFDANDQTANFIQMYPYLDSIVQSISASEYPFTPSNNAGIFGEYPPIELDVIEQTMSFESILAPATFQLDPPAQVLGTSSHLETIEDNLNFNQPTLQIPLIANIQPEVDFTDIEILYRTWQWDQTRKPQSLHLPFEHASSRSDIAPATLPLEYQFRSLSDSTMDVQQRLPKVPTTPKDLSSMNSFVSSQQSVAPRFNPIHFQTEIGERGRNPKEETISTVEVAQ
jgi:hypothetical protein